MVALLVLFESINTTQCKSAFVATAIIIILYTDANIWLFHFAFYYKFHIVFYKNKMHIKCMLLVKYADFLSLEIKTVFIQNWDTVISPWNLQNRTFFRALFSFVFWYLLTHKQMSQVMEQFNLLESVLGTDQVEILSLWKGFTVSFSEFLNKVW